MERVTLYLCLLALSNAITVAYCSVPDRTDLAPLTLPKVWYSTTDQGSWSSVGTWNTQPDGSGVSGTPTNIDQIIIQAGDTVEVNAGNQTVSSMTIEGVLKMDNDFTDQNFGILEGTGTLIVKETLPTYDPVYSSFFGTGTVVYRSPDSYTLPTSPSQYYNLIFQGSGTLNIDSDLTVTHDVRIERGTVDIGNHDLSVQGNWYNTAGATGLRSTGTVTFNGNHGSQTITGTTTFYNLTVNKVGQTLFVEDSLTVTSDLIINRGTVDSGTATIVVGDDWTNNGVYQGTGTVVFNGTNVTHTIDGFANTTFGSLKINGTNNTFEYNSQITLQSDLTVNSGTFRVAGIVSLSLDVPGHLRIGKDGFLNATLLETLTVGGNWSNNGLFAAGLNEVVFDAAAARTLSGETRFHHVEKRGGGTLALTDRCTVIGTLTLTDGHVHTADTSVLLLGVDASVAGGSASSYVDGPLTHAVSVSAVLGEARLFPFGSNEKYRPVTLSVDLTGTANTVYYRGELHEGPPPVRTLPAGIHHVSQLRYYSINQSALLPIEFTVDEATVRLAYNTDDGVDVPAELRLAKSNGRGDWIDIGGAGSGPVGYVTSDIFTSFSDFALGSSTDNNPLPIELLTLTAHPQASRVKIAWTTASETDNNQFVVERTADGKDYTAVTTVPGSGTSEEERVYQAWDDQPLAGQSYYRLRQIDFDGTSTYSRPVSVYLRNLTPVDVRLYPNPASKKATGVIRGLEEDTNLWVRLVDPTGQTRQRFRVSATRGTPVRFELPGLDHYSPGMYAVTVQSVRFHWSGKLLIE